jgi:ubiquinone/menaquinone biosynthesis C-methylase UbiE
MTTYLEVRVREHGWSNVDLRLTDATALPGELSVDGVVFSISLSAFRDCEGVLAQAVGFLRPGRRLVVVDAFLNRGRWYYAVTNLYTRLKAPVVGSKLDNRVRETALALLEEVEIDVVRAGLYSIISGRAPGGDPRPRDRREDGRGHRLA